MEDAENTVPFAQALNRRKSDQGLLSKMSNSSIKTRRQTISVPSAVSKGSQMKENSSSNNTNAMLLDTPSKTPSKHRLTLGSAQAYYFKGVSKTPIDAALSAKKKLNSSRLDESFDADSSFGGGALASYNGSVAAVDESFMTIASSSSEESDMLNKSTLSDTTELTASNFVLAASSRQRLSLSTQTEPFFKPKEAPEQAAVPVKETIADMMVEESRAPLDTINASNSSKRRNTLPPGTIVGASPAHRTDYGGTFVRRESLQGPSPGAEGRQSGGSYHDFLSSMRNTRLKRQQEREEVEKRRLSSGSDVSNTVATLLHSANNKQRDSFATSTTNVSIRLPSLSPSSKTDISLVASGGKPRKSEVSDVSGRSLDDLFEDMLPKQDGNTTAKSRPSISTMGSDNSDDDVGNESLDDLFSDMPLGGDDANTTAKTNVSLATATSMVELAQGRESSVGRKSMDDLFGDMVSGDDGETAELMDTSLFSKVSTAAEVVVDSNTTVASRTAASPASTITSAPSLSSRARIAANAFTGKSPRPLPSAIAFDSDENAPDALLETSGSPARSLRADHMSPFKSNSNKKSTTPTTLTPSQLTGSPRRIVNPRSVDSPARNTRSASKAKSPAKDDDDENTKRKRLSEEESSDSQNSSVLGTIEYGQSLDTSVVMEGSKRRKSSVSSAIRMSSMKKRGGRSARKTVAFGSPEVMEFNKGSPSKSLTPLPKSLIKQMNTMVDSTVEIEADMNALLNSVHETDVIPASTKVNAFRAGSTPAPSKDSILTEVAEETVELESNVQDLFAQPQDAMDAQADDMSVDSSSQEAGTADQASGISFLEGAAEATIELETNVQDLFSVPQVRSTAQSELSVDSPGGLVEAEHTVDLELDMNTLLAGADMGKPSSGRPSISRKDTIEEASDENMSMDIDSSRFGDESKMDEDNTIELETDIQALLGGSEVVKTQKLRFSMSDSPSTTGRRPRRSSASSRRFSIAPQGRLSLTADGSVIETDIDILSVEEDNSPNDTTMESVVAEEENTVEEVLDLSGTELVNIFGVGMDTKGEVSDVLTGVREATRELAVPMTTNAMNEILSEVCKEVDARTEPEVDLNALLNSSEENRDKYLTLQKALRAQDPGVCGQLEQLAGCVRNQVKTEWASWLVSVTESLKGPFDGIKDELHQNESSIDDASALVSETREILSTMENKAIQKAKRKSLEGRMVSTFASQPAPH